jgi:hypothetical protein
MCEFLAKLFGGGSNNDAATEQALADAKNSASAALLAQKQAQDQAQAASDSQSEGARLATETRMRKLLAAGPFGAALPTNYGDAQVATRQLYGSA